MQQRRLRLGDILDDYCPRERRITNHAVVAMIEDEVKQTRCTTCDADHEYKQARVPARRRKDAGALLSSPGTSVRPRAAQMPQDEPPGDDQMLDDDFDPAGVDSLPPALDAHDVHSAISEADRSDLDEDVPAHDEEGPVHRRLIRATLPRPEGQTPEW
jgi:hypothetical protein